MKKHLRNIIKERIFIAAVATGVMLFLTHFIIPEPEQNSYKEKKFWAKKVHSTQQFDMVICGDSRVYRGISPDDMKLNLGELSVFNFGFSSGSNDEKMLLESAKRLDPNGKKILLIGLTPHSLTLFAAKDAQFREVSNLKPEELLENLYFADFLGFFRSVNFINYIKSFTSKNNDIPYHMLYYNNGWVASWKDSPDTVGTLDSYRGIFKENKVSGIIKTQFISQVKKLAEQGIKIFAFRPPVPDCMYNLENELSFFNEKEIITEFEAAGGKWIEIDRKKYYSYDASHLHYKSAIELSKDLGLLLKEHIR